MNHRRTERADGKICVEIRDVVCFLCPQRPRSRLGCQREALRQIICLTEGPWKRNECAHEAGMSDAPNTAMHHRQGPRGRRRLSRRHTNAVYPHHGITSFQTHYCGTYLNTSFSLFPLATVSISEIALGGKKRKSSHWNGSALNQNGFLKPISGSVSESLQSFRHESRR